MICATTRGRLSEHALGVLDPRDGDAIDRHLEWCAACRKEARDLRRAAAVLPYALEPAEPPAELVDRIVEAIRHETPRGRPGSAAHGRSRLATVAALAAVLAVTALGWGAVMAGRASRAEQTAAVAEERSESLEAFQQLISQFEFSDADVELGPLGPTDPESDVSGTAATIILPRAEDRVLLVLSGLDPDGAPYEVVLRGGSEDALEIGVIPPALIATDGSAEFLGTFTEDLRRFGRVIVRDLTGTIVLRGALDAQSAVPSPTETRP